MPPWCLRWCRTRHCANFSAATQVSSDSIAMHALRAPGEHLHRHAGEPLQQVHAVDGLVDDDAAAVLGEPALPARVVLGGAIPLHVAARQHHAAEAPGIDGRLDLPRRIAKTRLEDRTHAHAGLLRLAQDVVGALHRRIERLFDHQVLAGADGRERGLQVQRRRRGDAHRIEARLFQQFVQVVGRKAKGMLSARTPRRWLRRRLTTPTERAPRAAATARAWKFAIAPAPMKPKPRGCVMDQCAIFQ